MGQLIYFINHTRKQWFCPICKWGEIINNKWIMEDILEIFRERWNNCRIEIIGAIGFNREELAEKGYKEIEWRGIED